MVISPNINKDDYIEAFKNIIFKENHENVTGFLNNITDKNDDTLMTPYVNVLKHIVEYSASDQDDIKQFDNHANHIIQCNASYIDKNALSDNFSNLFGIIYDVCYNVFNPTNDNDVSNKLLLHNIFDTINSIYLYDSVIDKDNVLQLLYTQIDEKNYGKFMTQLKSIVNNIIKNCSVYSAFDDSFKKLLNDIIITPDGSDYTRDDIYLSASIINITGFILVTLLMSMNFYIVE